MKNNLRPIQRLFALLKLNRDEIYRIYFFAAFIGIVNLTIPLGIQGIVNFIQIGTVSSSWIILSLLVILGVTLAGGLQILQFRLTENIQQNIFVRSSFELAYRIPRLKFNQISKYYGPELLNRFFDTMTIQKGTAKLLLDFATSAMQIVLALLLLSFYHPFFILFGLILVVVISILFRWTHPRGMETSLNESKYKYEMANWLEELARTYASFKLVGRTELPMKETDRHAMNYLGARQNHFKVLVAQFMSMVGIKVLVTAALLLLGGALVMEQQMNLGQFVAAEIIIVLILNNVEKLMRSIETAYDTLTGLEKIGYVTDLELEEDNLGLFIDFGNKPLAVKFDEVAIAGNEPGTQILNQLSFEIDPGGLTCITGTASSGKTTLMKVLSGLIAADSGRLIFNDKLNVNLNLNQLRDLIGDYYSEEELFNGTIWENITMGREGLDDQFILDLSKKIGLDEFILKNKNGYNHRILHRGQNLPEGVRKKILILRSMARKPLLLLVEDSFGNLPFKERDQIYQLYQNIPFPTTLVMVSTNPVWLRRAKNILVLDKGQLFNQGHFDMIKKDLLDLQIIENA